MWIAVWITLLNGLGSSSGFLNAARVSLAEGVPVGIVEISIAAAFIWAVFRGGDLQMRYPRLRMHPAIAWLIGLWTVTWVCGALGSIGSMSDARTLMITMREYATVPICIFVGYRALSTPRSVQWMVYCMAIAAVGNTVCLLIRFQGASELLLSNSQNINALRQIDYMTSYSVVGCLLFLYSILGGLRLVRGWIAAGLSALCLLGACASVSRTTLVGAFIGFLALYFVLPRGKRIKAVFKTLLITPVVVAAIWAGVGVASTLTHRDFGKVMVKQINSVLPGSDDDSTADQTKAWDSRIPSLIVEFKLFLTNPLTGHGFTATSDYLERGGTNWGAFGHNSWTAIMAGTGMFGLAAMLVTVGSMIVLGRNMILEQVDRSSVLMGALGFIVGVNTFIFGMCTMIFNARGAMYFGLFCGLVIRAREIQETTRYALGNAVADETVEAPWLHEGELALPADF